jgi:hypothetical protein
MRWLLFSRLSSALAQQCEHILQFAEQTTFREYTNGTCSSADIKNRIDRLKPDRIIIVVDDTDEHVSTLNRTLADRLLLPLFVVQNTHQFSSSTSILVLTAITDDADLDIVQNATSQLILTYPRLIK